MSKEPQPSSPGVSRRGLLFVLSSPSGAGKTTLANALLKADRDLTVSVSMTTRKPRPGEHEGTDYFFVEPAEFAAATKAGALIEWATVFDNSYGTPRPPVETALAGGRDMLFDIDWQGARQLRDKMGHDVVSVFVLPPSGRALEERLIRRAQDSQETVSQRMARAAEEISHWDEYDYVIVNDDLEASQATLLGILAAERHRRTRQKGLAEFVNTVAADL